MRRRARGPSRSGPYIPLLWRLFIPNASVLVAAAAILIVEPANGRIVALVGGLTVMLVTNVVLMRRAFTPLGRLTRFMDEIDPLRPGPRVPPLGPESEVTVLARAFNAMLGRLEAERRDSARRALLAQEAERRHVAAELHDEIGQTLTALVLQLDRLGGRVPPEYAPELREAAELARSSTDDVRRLARRLRPEVLDALGLVPALTNLCDRLAERTGLVIGRSLARDAVPRGKAAELVIYRVAQESLTNVVRHAGAHRADVALRREDGWVELVVADDGAGFPIPLNGDGGVRGMRERALLIGGEVDFGRSSAGGAEVRLRLPADSDGA